MHGMYAAPPTPRISNIQDWTRSRSAGVAECMRADNDGAFPVLVESEEGEPERKSPEPSLSSSATLTGSSDDEPPSEAEQIKQAWRAKQQIRKARNRHSQVYEKENGDAMHSPELELPVFYDLQMPMPGSPTPVAFAEPGTPRSLTRPVPVPPRRRPPPTWDGAVPASLETSRKSPTLSTIHEPPTATRSSTMPMPVPPRRKPPPTWDGGASVPTEQIRRSPILQTSAEPLTPHRSVTTPMSMSMPLPPMDLSRPPPKMWRSTTIDEIRAPTGFCHVASGVDALLAMEQQRQDETARVRACQSVPPPSPPPTTGERSSRSIFRCFTPSRPPSKTRSRSRGRPVISGPSNVQHGVFLGPGSIEMPRPVKAPPSPMLAISKEVDSKSPPSPSLSGPRPLPTPPRDLDRTRVEGMLAALGPCHSPRNSPCPSPQVLSAALAEKQELPVPDPIPAPIYARPQPAVERKIKRKPVPIYDAENDVIIYPQSRSSPATTSALASASASSDSVHVQDGAEGRSSVDGLAEPTVPRSPSPSAIRAALAWAGSPEADGVLADAKEDAETLVHDDDAGNVPMVDPVATSSPSDSGISFLPDLTDAADEVDEEPSAGAGRGADVKRISILERILTEMRETVGADAESCFEVDSAVDYAAVAERLRERARAMEGVDDDDDDFGDIIVDENPISKIMVHQETIVKID
ncbi:hypothetical protein PUNSTDRAFT_127351 [Punctularia strigosozonata HHB-11173 SS5]|uniref:uncharacterized protein n=1 Tax=Punctularia strigosozonata (strain HHB-11173) TaxID=741275 RepID=UPI000441869C|nr:uncharacterized protein PUNSTDRAFT_127351 [Punctularia strigosozonata HHB-11173 SS5]EIN06671.1 hypothetical protein PUNSTDRAFT_127351 [Punctularia strigosozonata HHB-11173 SS5]